MLYPQTYLYTKWWSVLVAGWERLGQGSTVEDLVLKSPSMKMGAVDPIPPFGGMDSSSNQFPAEFRSREKPFSLIRAPARLTLVAMIMHDG